jgi:hypothetical protein
VDIDTWLISATEDARRRGLDGLCPLLETLARSTRALRNADEVARTRRAFTDESPTTEKPS